MPKADEPQARMRLPKELLEKIKKEAKEEFRTVPAHIEKILTDYFKAKEKNNA